MTGHTSFPALALWARTVSTGGDKSCFRDTAIDAAGNVYAVGYITGTGAYTFGKGTTIRGTHAEDNAVLVKYEL